MKTTTSNLTTSALVLLMIFSANALNAYSIETTPDSLTENTILEADINEILISLEEDESLWTEEAITYEIYNENDELVYSKEVNRDDSADDKTFISFLGQSDFLMEINNTMVYRSIKN